MSVSTLPKQASSASARADESRRGLTFRSFIVCIFALLLMGMWNEYEIMYLGGNSLLENSPPSGAVTTLIVVVLICALLYRFRKSLGLITAELVCIYTALLVAAPLMTQGLWHRLFGLIAALPHGQDFKSYEALPLELWPHGENLCFNGQFVKRDDKAGFENFVFAGSGELKTDDVHWREKVWTVPMLVNAESNPDGSSTLAFTINRYQGEGNKRQELLVPGENFFFSCLVKTDKLSKASYYTVKMSVDGGPARTVIQDAAGTPKSFANSYRKVVTQKDKTTGLEKQVEIHESDRLLRIGKSPVAIPYEIKDKLTISIGLSGPGTLSVHDVQFFNSQAVEGAFTGVNVVRKSNYDKLAQDERNFTVVKPDNMFSPDGLGYLLRGFIPVKQWVTPMIMWSLLIGALFMGFFGFNIIFRKQWVESERFTFPMNIFPRQFFGEDAVDLGGMARGIFRSRAMWVGFCVCLPLVLLKGIHFYNPQVPAPPANDMWLSPSLANYVTNPTLKAFLGAADINLYFALLAIAMLIETDILFSIWVFFFLFQLWPTFGQAANFTRFEGYPWQWQQSIGGFIGYAILAVFTARRHLGNVIKQIVGRVKRTDQNEAVSYRTALAMILASLVFLAFWGVWTHMGWKASLLYFGWILVCGLTASKIRAEAGLPLGYWTPYFGMLFVSALGGFAIFGSTGMLISAIASGFMGVSCFFFIAPAQVEMMELGRHFKVRQRDIALALTIGLVGGLLIGGYTFMSWTYGMGADNFSYSWPFTQGSWYFGLTYKTGDAAMDSLVQSGSPIVTPKTAPLDFVNNINAKGILLGIALVIVFSVLRSLFTWFPLHPLGYVLVAAHFGAVFWFTCFVAWAIRAITLKIGGAHAIRKGLVPFAIGMFLACMVSIFVFEIVGMYLHAHGMTQVYALWP